MMTKPHDYNLVVYLLQGGGALGAYQMGVCESLLNHHMNPHWVIGTSIGGINAAIIAGNQPKDRIPKLKEFWATVASPLPSPFWGTQDSALRKLQNLLFSGWSVLYGQPGFFTPRLINPWFNLSQTPDHLSFYDTTALVKTLENVIDFNYLNEKEVRLTLGAVCVEEGVLVHFDSALQEITPYHVMASGALPPGFPAINIEGKNYWDGGLSSNTPLEYLFEEKVPRKLLCFVVDLFSINDETPKSMFDVIKRKKDILYASRHNQILKNFCEKHRLRQAIHKLCEANPENRNNVCLKELMLGHPCAINIIRFHYIAKEYELWSKDFEFSRQSIHDHRDLGFEDAEFALNHYTDWIDVIPDDSGVVIHNFERIPPGVTKHENI